MPPIKCELWSRIGQFPFTISQEDTGKMLFDKVMFCLGIREVWYFGLSCLDHKGQSCWLSPHIKVMEQPIKKKEPIKILLTFKFYPIDVDDIIQNITRRMLYLQVREYIQNSRLYSPPEHAFLLASYAVQARYGDHNVEVHKPDHVMKLKLIPQSVLSQLKLSKKEFSEKVLQMHVARQKLGREDAYKEYLQIAQDLDMFGSQYFPVRNSQGSTVLVGIDPFGIRMYYSENTLAPKTAMHLGEMTRVRFDSQNVVITLEDDRESELVLNVTNSMVSKRIFLRIVGYHDLYRRKQNPDRELMGEIMEEAETQKSRPAFNNSYECRTEKLAKKHDHLIDDEIKRKFKEHDGLIKQAVKELEDCQSELRTLEIRYREADKKKRKVEEKHYSSLRYKQMYDNEMRIHRHAVAPLVREQHNLAKQTQKLGRDTAARAAEAARMKSMLLEARQIESELLTELSALDIPEEMLIAQAGVSENDSAASGNAELKAGNSSTTAPESLWDTLQNTVKPPTESPWEHRELFGEIDYQTHTELETLQNDLEIYRDPEKTTQLDQMFIKNEHLGIRKYSVVRAILQAPLEERIKLFERM